MVFAMGLSRKTCLPARAAASVVSRCAAVFQDFLVRARRAAAVFPGKRLSFTGGPRIAGGDGQFARALDRIGKHVRPPAHADARDFHLIDSAASRAVRSSNSQSPPATP